MKLRLVSDMHLESGRKVNLDNTNGWDAIILAGDVCVASHFTKGPESPHYRLAAYYDSLFADLSNQYGHVFYVAGNHEHYRGRFFDTDNIITHRINGLDNFHYLCLDNPYADIAGYRFVGSTLWTDFHGGNIIHMDRAAFCMNDYHLITWTDGITYRKLNPKDVHARHLLEKQRILKAVDDADKVVVITHHAPSELSVHTRYLNSRDMYLNSSYHSRLADIILDRPQIKLWVHGHTHDVFDYKLGDTRVVCNPMGYPGENTGYIGDLELIV